MAGSMSIRLSSTEGLGFSSGTGHPGEGCNLELGKIACNNYGSRTFSNLLVLVPSRKIPSGTYTDTDSDGVRS